MLSSARETGGGSGCPASRNRCRRSLGVSLSACARLSSTWAEGCTLRPCSSQTYQEVPILASCATSSRRSPGVRRRKPGGSPTLAGERFARRLRKKSARASRRSFFCISRCSITWWSETYDQQTLVLVSPREHTQGEHLRQDVTCTWREDCSLSGGRTFFHCSQNRGGMYVSTIWYISAARLEHGTGRYQEPH